MPSFCLFYFFCTHTHTQTHTTRENAYGQMLLQGDKTKGNRVVLVSRISFFCYFLYWDLGFSFFSFCTLEGWDGIDVFFNEFFFCLVNVKMKDEIDICVWKKWLKAVRLLTGTTLGASHDSCSCLGFIGKI